MALLGISWGLAFVMIDAAALTFAYLFVVFNSSQGKKCGFSYFITFV